MLAFTNVAGWIILLLHCQDQPCTIPQPHRISHRGRVLLSGGVSESSHPHETGCGSTLCPETA